jgi:hypothetical protein
VGGLKHQKEKRSMDYFAGLDVSVKETSVCIVDDTGKIAREVKVASEPEALLAVLKNPGYHFKRIGLCVEPYKAFGRRLTVPPRSFCVLPVSHHVGNDLKADVTGKGVERLRALTHHGHRTLAIGKIKIGKVRDGSGQIGVLPY